MPTLSRWHKGQPPAAGFTLIELLVVIALMALIVGVVPIAFDRLSESSQYRSAVREVLTDLRAARQQAQGEGVESRFVVDLDARTFGVEGGAVHAVPDELALHAVMAADETAGPDLLSIRFLPQGGASGGSVDLIRPSGSGVRLRVDWFTGRIEQEAINP